MYQFSASPGHFHPSSSADASGRTWLPSEFRNLPRPTNDYKSLELEALWFRAGIGAMAMGAGAALLLALAGALWWMLGFSFAGGIDIVSVIIFVTAMLSVPLALSGRSAHNKLRALKTRGLTTTAYVIDRWEEVVQDEDEQSVRLYYALAFAAGGQIISFKVAGGMLDRQYEVGDTVAVRFLPEDPSAFQLINDRPSRYLR